MLWHMRDKTMKMHTSLAITALSLNLASCVDVGALPDTRPFAMGFTPWPYEASIAAIDSTYTFINAGGDLAAHHFQQGIPWTANDPGKPEDWDGAVREEIDTRADMTKRVPDLYLAVDCLNGARDGLADLWGAEANMALPSPWDARGFGDPEAAAVFADFCLALMERFEAGYGRPVRWFNFASEISELMLNDASAFDDFIGFASSVYGELKAARPHVSFMVSVALKKPGGEEMAKVKAGFTRIDAFYDTLGISAYPYAFFSHEDSGDPAKLPASWLAQTLEISSGKPLFISETGWPAQDISIPAYGLEVDASECKQAAYLRTLLSEAAGLGAEGIVWFTHRDYDRLWEDTLGSDDLSRIWRDTGLLDGSGRARDGLAVWRAWMKLPRE